MLCFATSTTLAESPVDFNQDVRPILATHCLNCHGRDAEHREAGLRLDTRAGAVVELDSGEFAVVPGHPEQSELIARVSTDDVDFRMPPAETRTVLRDEEIDVLRRWIEQGGNYEDFWSFATPSRPALPDLEQRNAARNPIDYFIINRLERADLELAAEADRYALVRRLSLDLRGLPPSLEEVNAFVDDTRPAAYERLVARFLDDPRYGERWARLWLDLARYADSRGYGSDPLRPNMWRYRDWVIDAFNTNLGYDNFTIEQLAGDQLPDPTLSQRMATAFHRNTMTNTEGGTDDEEFRVAAVKDRAETTMQVWMGLTMQCANCHDHKYDPLSQREYYSLYAIFNQTADKDLPDESPTIPAPSPQIDAEIQHVSARIAAINEDIIETRKRLAAEKASTEVAPQVGRFVRIELPGKGKILSLAEVQVFHDETNVATKGKATQSSVSNDAPATLAIDGNTDGHFFDARSTTHTTTENSPWWEVDLGEATSINRVVIWNRTDGSVGSRLANFRISLLDTNRKPVWQTDVAEAPSPSDAFKLKPLSPLEKEIQSLRDQITKLEKSKPAIPTLPIMRELAVDQRRTTHLMVKGNFLSPGDVVEANVPTSIHPAAKDLPRNRLGVAQWLLDEENPLTSRVAVNRVWSQLFGRGLVETEEDFGTQGAPPSHPQLLDWLATEFVRLQWDMKRFVTLVVSSATYRQSSRVTPRSLQLDPRNRLLSRGPRYRLEAEMIRDQALELGGLLSTRMYGPSVYPFQPKGLWRAAFNGQRTWPISDGEDRFRRGLYTFWRRTVPYPSMQTFDAPSREICTMRRIRTNTPLQAFVTLNDPVYVEAAQGLARRLLREGGANPTDRANFGLRLCLSRPPNNKRVKVLVDLYESQLTHFQTDAAAAMQLATDPIGPLPDGINAAELAALTVVANVLLNLDGVLTKG